MWPEAVLKGSWKTVLRRQSIVDGQNAKTSDVHCPGSKWRTGQPPHPKIPKERLVRYGMINFLAQSP